MVGLYSIFVFSQIWANGMETNSLRLRPQLKSNLLLPVDLAERMLTKEPFYSFFTLFKSQNKGPNVRT